MIVAGDAVHVIDPEPVEVVDTTKRGDLYGRIPPGFTHSYDSRVAPIAAGAAISHLGALASLAALARPVLET